MSSFHYRIIKRFCDLMLAALLSIVTLPLLLLIAILVKLSSKGPMFYQWNVVGLLRRM